MKKRICFVLLLMSCSLCLCFMSSTYSRYVAGTTGNIDILFAKWQILINTQDITDQNNSNITITPTIEQNENIRENTVAPTSKGYFDIDIDPTNVDVSFRYSIDLEIDNEHKFTFLNFSQINFGAIRYCIRHPEFMKKLNQ